MKKSCCGGNKAKKKSGLVDGLLLGLVPHIGCIAFILFSIIGATALSSLVKPLLSSSNFFYGVIILSIILATIASIIYLKQNSATIAESWKYLLTLYSSTIALNVLMFAVIFPYLANIGSDRAVDSGMNITLAVDIPCTGHAPIIIDELSTLEGVMNVHFTAPNEFNVQYDPELAAINDILNLDIFNTYRAVVLNSL